MTMMQSALRMVESRCAMTKLVRPLSSTSSAFWISISVWVSMDEVASSSMRILGSFSSARAKEMQLSLTHGQRRAALVDLGHDSPWASRG